VKKQINGFITWEPSPYGDKPSIDFYTYDPTKMEHRKGSGMVVVREHSFEVEIPDDFDPRPAQIAALDEQITKTRAEFTKRITELQEQKSRLLCIEMA
jgi:hypothetical protein